MLQLHHFPLCLKLLVFRKIANVNSFDKKLSACLMKQTFDEKKHIDCTYNSTYIRHYPTVSRKRLGGEHYVHCIYCIYLYIPTWTTSLLFIPPIVVLPASIKKEVCLSWCQRRLILPLLIPPPTPSPPPAGPRQAVVGGLVGCAWKP